MFSYRQQTLVVDQVAVETSYLMWGATRCLVQLNNIKACIASGHCQTGEST